MEAWPEERLRSNGCIVPGAVAVELLAHLKDKPVTLWDDHLRYWLELALLGRTAEGHTLKDANRPA